MDRNCNCILRSIYLTPIKPRSILLINITTTWFRSNNPNKPHYVGTLFNLLYYLTYRVLKNVIAQLIPFTANEIARIHMFDTKALATLANRMATVKG